MEYCLVKILLAEVLVEIFMKQIIIDIFIFSNFSKCLEYVLNELYQKSFY